MSTALATRPEVRPHHVPLGHLAQLVHVVWLAGHLAAGIIWSVARHRYEQLYAAPPRVDDLAEHGSGAAAAIPWIDATDSLIPWLVAGLVPAAVLARWLPHRRAYLLAWAVIWPVGMVLLRGYLPYLMD